MLVSVNVGHVAPCGTFTVVEPLVAVPVSVTVPVYVPVSQVSENAYAPGAPDAGAPVTVLPIVTAIWLRVSGLTIVPEAVPPAAIAVALGWV